MTEKILFEKEGHIAVLTLNQPETRNALTDIDLVDGIVAACENVNRDAEIRVLIVTGNGPAFSSGGNIKHMRDKIGTLKGDAAPVLDNHRSVIALISLAVSLCDVAPIPARPVPADCASC